MANALLAIETLSMLVLVCWAARRAIYMQVGRTPLADVLAVTAIGGGATEYALYNVYTWFAPASLAAQFGALDRVALTLLYVGVAAWIVLPALRQRSAFNGGLR